MKSKRKLLYIDRKFQLQTLIYFNTLVGVILLLLFLAQWNFIHELTEPKAVRNAYLLFGIIAVFTFLLTNLVCLLITHRISGPILNLRNHLERIAQNPSAEFKPLKFRTTDFFQELPPLVNRVLKPKRDG